MKKLFLATAVGLPLIAAGCMTTDYYADDLAVARRLDDDRRGQQQQAQQTQQTQRTQQLTRTDRGDADTRVQTYETRRDGQQPTISRDADEQRREMRAMQTQLEDIDRRIEQVEADMERQPEAQREQTQREVTQLRERQQRAETMMRDAEREENPLAFRETRDELADAVNELEIGIYRLQVAGE